MSSSDLYASDLMLGGFIQYFRWLSLFRIVCYKHLYLHFQFERFLIPNSICELLCYHDCWCIQIAADNAWHDAGINNADIFQTMNLGILRP